VHKLSKLETMEDFVRDLMSQRRSHLSRMGSMEDGENDSGRSVTDGYTFTISEESQSHLRVGQFGRTTCRDDVVIHHIAPDHIKPMKKFTYPVYDVVKYGEAYASGSHVDYTRLIEDHDISAKRIKSISISRENECEKSLLSKMMLTGAPIHVVNPSNGTIFRLFDLHVNCYIVDTTKDKYHYNVQIPELRSKFTDADLIIAKSNRPPNAQYYYGIRSGLPGKYVVEFCLCPNPWGDYFEKSSNRSLSYVGPMKDDIQLEYDRKGKRKTCLLVKYPAHYRYTTSQTNSFLGKFRGKHRDSFFLESTLRLETTPTGRTCRTPISFFSSVDVPNFCKDKGSRFASFYSERSQSVEVPLSNATHYSAWDMQDAIPLPRFFELDGAYFNYEPGDRLDGDGYYISVETVIPTIQRFDLANVPESRPIYCFLDRDSAHQFLPALVKSEYLVPNNIEYDITESKNVLATHSTEVHNSVVALPKTADQLLREFPRLTRIRLLHFLTPERGYTLLSDGRYQISSEQIPEYLYPTIESTSATIGSPGRYCISEWFSLVCTHSYYSVIEHSGFDLSNLVRVSSENGFWLLPQHSTDEFRRWKIVWDPGYSKV